jgi:hypothetical protein
MGIYEIEKRIIKNISKSFTSGQAAAALGARLQNIVFSSEEEVCWGMYVNNDMLNKYSDHEIGTKFKYDRSSLITGTLINEVQIYDEADVYELDSLAGEFLGAQRFRIDAMDYLMYRICAMLERNASAFQPIKVAEGLKLYTSAEENFEIRTLASQIFDVPHEEYFKTIRSWMK